MLEKIKAIARTISKDYWLCPCFVIFCILIFRNLHHLRPEYWMGVRIAAYVIAMIQLLLCSSIILAERKTITPGKYVILYSTLFITSLIYLFTFPSNDIQPIFELKIGPGITLITGLYGFRVLRNSKSVFWKIVGYLVSFVAMLISSFLLLKAGAWNG